MEPNNRFIARQAILDSNSHCFGYELLYRNADTDRAIFEDASQASMQVFDSAYLFGIEVLCGESKAFVNCDTQVLISDFINVLQPGRTVLEISESVSADADILRICNKLKANGYLLALEYSGSDAAVGFLPVVDFVKVDMRLASPEVVSFLQDRISPTTKLLAHRVETRDDFERARGLEFELFQGFYFCQPQVLATKSLSPSRISSLRLLQATVNEELKFSELEKIIKEDAALCYRLLRFINSVEFCHRVSIQSIRHALALLGERNTRRWALLTGTVLAADDKPRELLRCALVRAKLIELVAHYARCSEYEGFLVGLLSLMAVMLDSTSVIDRLEIPVTVSAALAGRDGRLRDLLNLVISYERGEWTQCEALATSLHLGETELSSAYMQSVAWVTKIPI
jgi:EAL and modified HD-GYP domain-containing signal transduction protein